MAHHEDDDEYPVSGFVTDPPRSSRYESSLDEVTDQEGEVIGPDWSEFAQIVQDTASFILDEFLDEEPVTGAIEVQLADELQDAIARPMPPVSSAPPTPPPAPKRSASKSPPEAPKPTALAANETMEVEIFRESTDPDLHNDAFAATGIGIIHVDTGEILATEDIVQLSSDRDSLAVSLGKVRLPVEGIWGPFLAEMKAEILAEEDLRQRAAYVYVFSTVLRALTGTTQVEDALAGLSDEAGGVLRSSLLERLASVWMQPERGFFDILGRLERLDSQVEGNLATLRRSSIALERLLDGALSSEQRVHLRELMIPPETLPALVVQAVEGHASKNFSQSLHAWRRLGKHANSELKRGATLLVPYLLSGHASFFEVVEQMLAEGTSTRGMLTFMQRESFIQGNWVSEARALKRLVAQDGRLGQRLTDESEEGRRRLLRESAARLFRLATILNRISRTQVESDVADPELEGMDGYRVLRDSVSLHASSLVTLRRLERWAREKGDLVTVEQALVSQIPLVDEPELIAILWEKLAALHDETTADIRIIADYLQMSLQNDPTCLPALISLGQQIIRHGAFSDMLHLSGTPQGEESRNVNSAWRRAEILERTAGDAREILTLYRAARDEQPDSTHLFFCVERALARLADWRGLRTLYETVLGDKDSRLSTQLRAAGRFLDVTHLALEAFLEDPSDDFAERWKSLFSRDQQRDEGALWRIAADAVQSDQAATIVRTIEETEFSTRNNHGVVRDRILVWHAYLSEYHARNEGAAISAYRELFVSASEIFQRRFALQGLLRGRDFTWVAERVLEEPDLFGWALPDVEEIRYESYRICIAGELFALGGQYPRALDTFAAAAEIAQDDREKAEISERAFHHALRSRHWAEGFQFATQCFENETVRAVTEFTRHLACCLDRPDAVLRHLDLLELQSPSPVVLLDDVELAYRARDFKRLQRLFEKALSSAEAGSIDFRAFLLEQAILVGAWGHEAPEMTISCLDDLWSLDVAVSGSPFFAVGGYLRTYARLGRKDKLEEWRSYARSNFTPQVAEALCAEASVYEEAKSGLDAQKWYKARIPKVPGPLQPYYRWMAAMLGWMFGKPRADVAHELIGATESGDPTHRVGTYYSALAVRESDPTDFVDQLRTLRRAGNARPVQQWATIRGLFHTAITLNAPDKALETMTTDDTFLVFEWSQLAVEIFGRSLRRTAAVEQLRERSRNARGQRVLQLELSQIVGDVGMFPRLAAQGIPAAQVLIELQAAQGERPHAPGWNVGIRFMDLKRAIAEESAEQVRRRLMSYLLEVDEVFWGSPWCPIRLVNADLTRFGLSVDELRSLHQRVSDFEHGGIGAEARLMVARQFQRMGQRDLALSLMPDDMTDDCVSVAWALFGHTLDAFATSPKASSWALAFWTKRAEATKGLEAECYYEMGHYHEVAGRLEDALTAYLASLEACATFLPAQIATARELIRRNDWKVLAKVVEQQFEAAKLPAERSSLAFRLGYIWDRRLRTEPEADARAEAWYLEVLRTRPKHLPSYEALLVIAYRQFNYEAAAQYLSRLAELTKSNAVRSAYLVELATICEHQLNDLRGALEAYHAAFILDVNQTLAFFGILRADTQGDIAVSSILRRLDAGVTQREAGDLAHHLFSLARRNTDAMNALRRIFPDHYGMHLARLARGLEEGRLEVESIAALERTYQDPETKILTMAVERLGAPTQLVGESLHNASTLGTDPFSEGRLVRALHFAWTQRDLEALGLLATSKARRASSPLLRSAELTWMVATQYMRGDRQGALEVCERLLSQYLDFLPSIKLARLIAEDVQRWESIVRWNQRDAQLSKVPAIADANRLRASEVQRSHLGDLDAALETLRKVLKSTPRHKDAFARLSDILWLRRDFADLLSAYEHQIKHSQKDEEICEFLNRMAEIALQQMNDRRGAIGYLTRSLQRIATQKRRLRQLAELYEAEHMFDRAVSCWTSMAKLTNDSEELHRIWSQVGYLIEVELKTPNEAKQAYLSALACDESDVSALMALSRVCESRREYQEALRYLHKALELSRDSNVQKTARVSMYRVTTRAEMSLDDVLSAGATLLFHHPETLEAVDDMRSRLVAGGKGDEVVDVFRALAIEAITQDARHSMSAHFEIARRLGHHDRAFRLSGLAIHTDGATDSVKDYYRQNCEPRRWPRRSIPSDLSGGVLHEQLVAPVIELLRLSREGVEEAMEAMPGAEFIKRSNRLKEHRGLAQQLAFQWPQLYGLELRDVYMSPTPIKGGSYVIFDQGVRLVLDGRWNDATDPTELLVGLGRNLAAMSMGIHPWNMFTREEQVGVFFAVVSRFVSGWGIAHHPVPQGFSVPRLTRWLQRKGQRVAPYALEISGRFGAQAVERQFDVLRISLERLAIAPIDDPGRSMRFAQFGAEQGIGEPPYLFLLGVPTEKIRRALGITNGDLE